MPPSLAALQPTPIRWPRHLFEDGIDACFTCRGRRAKETCAQWYVPYCNFHSFIDELITTVLEKFHDPGTNMHHHLIYFTFAILSNFEASG